MDAMESGRIASVLESARRAIGEDEKNANAIFRVRVDLMEGVRCSITAQSSDPLSFEEPAGPRLGLGCALKREGRDIGMAPGEMFLASVGSCLAVAYGVYAELMGIKLDQASVEVAGYLDLRGVLDLAPGVSCGFERAEYHAMLRSGADRARLEELALVADRKSPILATARQGIRIDPSFTINGKPFVSEPA